MERITKYLLPYAANVLLLWLAIAVYQTNNYYSSFLSPETQTILFYFAVAYTAGGLIYYLLIPKKEIPVTKGLLILRWLKHAISYVLAAGASHKKPSKDENTALLFGIVKFFFLPLMLNFFFANIGDVGSSASALRAGGELSVEMFNAVIFPLLIALIFTIDTLYFAFGYTFEATFLNNTVRSVEPTLLGWAVTLASYPPFNGIIGTYLLWYANDYITFDSDVATVGIRLLIVSFLIIYVWASVALGTRCSNLTNRGIVGRFPYSLIRHPAYAAKNIAWWITVLPLLNPVAYASMFAWSTIYYLRAVTEERHLLRDPDYQNYVERVRYKFIPGIW